MKPPPERTADPHGEFWVIFQSGGQLAFYPQALDLPKLRELMDRAVERLSIGSQC
ncbi:protein of unknown function [Beijerinckiaceae bacterium RH AL1]|nr:hypothetical protein [Beijerinckiaceae bacterium]VVB42605.1 protein of unknown function [Beijerinckiaceae bacterium RH AL8]VVB42608.1 protein of unknown function [Beijerinckiaceae bacterium RH CH11]VVC53403.1 protein of unknown function [Beijerinckiaceae bacterium RH AL1]